MSSHDSKKAPNGPGSSRPGAGGHQDKGPNGRPAKPATMLQNSKSHTTFGSTIRNLRHASDSVLPRAPSLHLLSQLTQSLTRFASTMKDRGHPARTQNPVAPSVSGQMTVCSVNPYVHQITKSHSRVKQTSATSLHSRIPSLQSHKLLPHISTSKRHASLPPKKSDLRFRASKGPKHKANPQHNPRLPRNPLGPSTSSEFPQNTNEQQNASANAATATGTEQNFDSNCLTSVSRAIINPDEESSARNGSTVPVQLPTGVPRERQDKSLREQKPVLPSEIRKGHPEDVRTHVDILRIPQGFAYRRGSPRESREEGTLISEGPAGYRNHPPINLHADKSDNHSTNPAGLVPRQELIRASKKSVGSQETLSCEREISIESNPDPIPVRSDLFEAPADVTSHEDFPRRFDRDSTVSPLARSISTSSFNANSQTQDPETPPSNVGTSYYPLEHPQEEGCSSHEQTEEASVKAIPLTPRNETTPRITSRTSNDTDHGNHHSEHLAALLGNDVVNDIEAIPKKLPRTVTPMQDLTTVREYAPKAEHIDVTMKHSVKMKQSDPACSSEYINSRRFLSQFPLVKGCKCSGETSGSQADNARLNSHRDSCEESSVSLTQKSTEVVALGVHNEGSAARCEPIAKLKKRKDCKTPEPASSDIKNIQEDIRIWKDLYAGCLERLRSLQQMNHIKAASEEFNGQNRHHSSAGHPSSQSYIKKIEGGMDEAVRVLENEYDQVESALRKHSAVLAELVSTLQTRMNFQRKSSESSEHCDVHDADGDDRNAIKDNIHHLKALITENETLTMQLAAERAKQQVLRQVQATNDVAGESIAATEEKLHRTNSLLKMQMKRLQYELSRLNEAQNIEMKAGVILVDQAEADAKNDLEALYCLQESNDRLHEMLSSKRFVSGQRVFKRGSRGSFLSEEMLGCSPRKDNLEYMKTVSDRVQRNVDLVGDELQYLYATGQRMCNYTSEINEEIRKNEFTWLQLRKERDDLTKDLFPDQERLHKMQDVAKEKLDLESKLRKENMLFRHQLEEFQKDLLEVETELMSGAITRRTEATKNKVNELETLYENAKLHNNKLREECDVKGLTISRYDSLASLSIDEEEFQRQISEKIQKMELRIQADMDRRLLRPKRYVFEAPGKAKVSFRGQRNVIKAPKNVAEWRRKRGDAPKGASEPPKPQQPKDAQELRREILAKLAEEKDRAKNQLLRYEAHQARHAAEAGMAVEPNTQELNELLSRLGMFLGQTLGQDSTSRPASTVQPTSSQGPSLHGGEFGETLMHLIVQLDQLQSALTGEESRRRPVRPTQTSERHRELLDTLPATQSKRGSGTSNPSHHHKENNN